MTTQGKRRWSDIKTSPKTPKNHDHPAVMAGQHGKHHMQKDASWRKTENGQKQKLRTNRIEAPTHRSIEKTGQEDEEKHEQKLEKNQTSKTNSKNISSETHAQILRGDKHTCHTLVQELIVYPCIIVSSFGYQLFFVCLQISWFGYIICLCTANVH